MLKKANLAQLVTFKKGKLGPGNNSTAIYIYIYVYVVESKLGPRFGFFESKPGPRFGFLSQNLVQGCVKTWSKSFFCLFPPNCVVFFGYLTKIQVVCRGAKIIVWQCVRVSKKGFSKKKKKVCTFLLLSFLGWRKKKI